MLFKNTTLKPCLLNNCRRNFLIIFFLIFCYTISLGNTNTQLVNDFINKNKEILVPDVINRNYLQKAKTVKARESEVLQVVNKVLQAYAYSKNIDNVNDKSISLYLEALSEAEKINDENLLIYVNTQIGFFYYSFSEYIKAMPYFIKSSSLLNKNTVDNLIQPADVYRKNAYFFGSVNEHQKSIDYLLKALKFTPSNSELYPTFLNNIGSSYYKLGAVESAYSYFIKAKDVSLENNNLIRYAKVLGDLALIHFDKKEYQQSKVLLQKDIEISQQNGADKNTMYAQILLSKVYIGTSEFNKAKQTLTLASKYVSSKEYLKSYAYEIAQLNLLIALKTKNIALELEARRALDIFGADIVTKDGKEAVKLVGWETQKQQFYAKLEAEKDKVEKANLKLWIVFGIVLFIIVLTFFVVRSIQLRFKNIEALYQKNILQYKINQLQSISKLDEYHLTLKSYHSYLSDQSKQMSLIENELNKLKANSVTKDQTKVFLQEILDQQKMSGTNWMSLKNTFLKEENDYYNALLENFPDLSEINLRIVILNKMDLRPAEIAMVLNIKIDVVDDALQRLRKNFKGSF